MPNSKELKIYFCITGETPKGAYFAEPHSAIFSKRLVLSGVSEPRSAICLFFPEFN